MRC
ncbi:phosphoenolpyruvate carboxykinase family protein, partial [Vibrio parahaemolyticus 861]|jgi:short-subunit dehydrogenase